MPSHRSSAIVVQELFRQARESVLIASYALDTARALITSANFTEAAHERNIEAGTLISDPLLVRALKAQFDTLVDHGDLELVPGIRGDSLSP
jgi:phosphatidylserine/phosphatidylglycerophosphate/cardiolipin synthase-like enzyme